MSQYDSNKKIMIDEDNPNVKVLVNDREEWESGPPEDKSERLQGIRHREGEFRAYLRCKQPSNACTKCEFLKPCKDLNSAYKMEGNSEQ